jgi:hypothetical protein
MHRIAYLLPLLTLLLVGCDSSPQPPTTAATLERRSNPSADAVTSGAVKWRSNRHGPAQPVSPSAETTAPATAPRTLEWDDLMPADFDPGAPFQNIDTANLADDDPRAQEMLAKLRKLWDEAPVVTALDGAQIRLPGFAVPLETDGEIATRFLLVPYVGACIHVPPPPLNQTVLVEAPKGARIRHVFDPVWVTGRLTARRATTELANAGYTLTATDVKPYAEKQR